MSRRTPKTVTYEIEFEDDYPNGAPYCLHGPAIRLKVIKEPQLEYSHWVICIIEKIEIQNL